MQESEREQEGGRSEENDRETAPVSDSVTVRPDTSAESAVVPAMIDYEEFDHKETDNEWKLIKEPAQAAKVFKENLLREHASGKPLSMKMDEEWAEHCCLRVNLTILFQQHQRCLLKATSSGLQEGCWPTAFCTTALMSQD
ncbi:hypothetical protein GJAV_G00080030 [Gymnothorax javanicus]|nr:hypothetical protein GJAV_G00080030 [Gymnothorax javanicus]